MTNAFLHLANHHLRDLELYQPGKPIEEVQRELNLTHVIKLASNENPLGPSPKAVAAAQKALTDMHRYPDSRAHSLKCKLAQHWQISPDHITLGNGSDQNLEMVIRTFVTANLNAEVICSEYAFANFAITTKTYGAKPVIVAAKQWGHDLAAMANAITENTQAIFIANPNNPTGTWNTEDELITFLEKIPKNIIVVIDEAYYEYVDVKAYPNTINLQKRYKNLIITRTFSKLYGLAGLRIGYSISDPDIANLLHRVRLPFNANSMAMAAAIAALDDKEHQEKSLEVNKNGKIYLEQALTTMGFHFIPSAGNFLTIDVRQNGQHVFEALLREGVIVRPLLPYKMTNYIRVTIGLEDENQRFITALKKILR